jgi:ribokinase
MVVKRKLTLLLNYAGDGIMDGHFEACMRGQKGDREKVMAVRRIDVFGLGQCSLDYIGRVDAFPPADSKCEFTDLTIQGGGPVATALVALSRWGAETALAGVVGDDSFGKSIAGSLNAEGVDTTGVVVRDGCASQFAFIAAEPGIGRRTIFWRRPTGAALTPGEIDFDRLRSAGALLTDGLFAEASLAAAREAKRAGVPVVVDAGSLRDGMLELAALSDFFIASESFARALIEEENPRKACRRIAELGPSLAGVTLGKRGYVARNGNTWIERPAHPAAAVDTTGCGDIFHAGFVHGLLAGWTTERSLDFGAWAASRVSLELGGRAGIPDLKDYPGHDAGQREILPG